MKTTVYDIQKLKCGGHCPTEEIREGFSEETWGQENSKIRQGKKKKDNQAEKIKGMICTRQLTITTVQGVK